jgi:hypothetical protein
MNNLSINSIKYGQTWKNKKTGKIVFVKDQVLSYRNSKPESVVEVLDSEGQQLNDIKTEDFQKNYEKIEFDIERLLPSLLQYLSDSSLYSKLEIIARRLHPGGYFQVGCTVFIASPLFLDENDLRRATICEKSYKITNIRPSETIPLLSILTLESVYYRKETIEVPMYLDRISEVDAYSCLRRYDMPY